MITASARASTAARAARAQPAGPARSSWPGKCIRPEWAASTPGAAGARGGLAIADHRQPLGLAAAGHPRTCR
jgi:hypothetical protein